MNTTIAKMTASKPHSRLKLKPQTKPNQTQSNPTKPNLKPKPKQLPENTTTTVTTQLQNNQKTGSKRLKPTSYREIHTQLSLHCLHTRIR